MYIVQQYTAKQKTAGNNSKIVCPKTIGLHTKLHNIKQNKKASK